MKQTKTILLSTALLATLSACSSNIRSQASSDAPSGTAMNIQAEQSAQELQRRESLIDDILNNRQCPVMSEFHACGLETSQAGTLTRLLLNDDNGNRLEMTLFPVSDRMEERIYNEYASDIGFYGKSDTSDTPQAYIGSEISKKYGSNDIYQNLAMQSSTSKSEENAKSKNVSIILDESGKPVQKTIQYSDKSDDIQRELFIYDSSGRLSQHSIEKGLYFTNYELYYYTYTGDSPCFSDVRHYRNPWNGKQQDALVSKTHYHYPESPANGLTLTQQSFTEQGQVSTEKFKYTENGCKKILEWNMADAVTQYDRTDRSWISTQQPISNGGRVYEPSDYQQIIDEDAAHLSRHFELAQTETTQADFESIMGFNPSHFAKCGKDCPVENITWFQALAYCNAKSQKENLETCYILEDCSEKFESCQKIAFKGLDCKGYRLPTDEEWREMARRNDLHVITDQQAFMDIAELYGIDQKPVLDRQKQLTEQDSAFGTVITHFHRSIATLSTPKQKTSPVSKEHRDFNNLWDFYGNVSEWIWDWYGYASRSGDSLGPDRGLCRIVRGGSFLSYDIDVSRRYCYPPERGASAIGFRTAKTSQP